MYKNIRFYVHISI